MYKDFSKNEEKKTQAHNLETGSNDQCFYNKPSKPSRFCSAASISVPARETMGK